MNSPGTKYNIDIAMYIYNNAHKLYSYSFTNKLYSYSYSFNFTNLNDGSLAGPNHQQHGDGITWKYI